MAADLKAKIVVTTDHKPAVSGLGEVAAAEARVGSAAAAAAGQTEAAAGRTETAWRGIVGRLTALASGIGALFAGREVFAATRELQDQRSALEFAAGSAEEARAAMADLDRVGRAQGQTVSSLATAWIRLKNLGLDPSARALSAYGNIAAANAGKSVMDFAEAVADAITGEWERLKEFGLKASVEGDKVALRFRGTTRLIANDAKAIEEALIRIGEVDFAGAAAAKADNLGAAFDRLGDSFRRVLGAGGQSPLAKDVADGAKIAGGWLDYLADKMAKWWDPKQAGISPRLAGEERMNALLERRAALLADELRLQADVRLAEARTGVRPGQARVAAVARAELRATRAELARVQTALGEMSTAAEQAAAKAATAAKDLAGAPLKNALAAANAAYAGANGFAKLKGDIAGASDALKAMGQALKGPAPTATVADRLREIIALRDQAEASLKTGDLATALPKIQAGAKAIEEFIKSGGVADGTIGSLAQQFQRMGDAAAQGARDGKDAVDAAAKAMKVELTVRPVLDEAALAEITRRLRAAAQVTPEMLRAAGLAGAEHTTTPGGQSSRAQIAPGAGSTGAAGAAAAMVEAASRAARASVERAFKAPLPIRLDASVAAAAVVRQVQEALNAAQLTVPVTAVVTQVQGGGAGADAAGKAAAKTGDMQG